MIRGVGTAVAAAAAAAVIAEIASRRGRVRTGEGRAGQIMQEGHLQIAQAAVELFLGGGLLGRSWAVAWHLAVLLRFYLLLQPKSIPFYALLSRTHVGKY